MSKTKICLGVNVDHIATLRQVRGGLTDYPNLLDLSKIAMKAGATQITIHLREDRRHIQLSDLKTLSKNKIPLNLEMAHTPEMEKLALKFRPSWVCLVPEKRQELTTEGGLDVLSFKNELQALTKKLQKHGIKVSLFINASIKQVEAAQNIGADAVEFHTGHWVLAKDSQKKALWKKLVQAAQRAHRLGMRVHAGHGLNYDTIATIRNLPHLVEVNIGHSLICYALEYGLAKAIRKMQQLL